MQAERKIWNDERMDEFAARTEANFGEVREEFRDLRGEMRGEFKAVRGEIRESGIELHGKIDRMDERIHDEIVGVRGEIVGVRDEVVGVRDEIVGVRGEIVGVRDRADNGIAQLRADMNERFAGLDHRLDTLTGALIAGFISLIIIHFVG